jgi:hypothetical protein
MGVVGAILRDMRTSLYEVEKIHVVARNGFDYESARKPVENSDLR